MCYFNFIIKNYLEFLISSSYTTILRLFLNDAYQSLFDTFIILVNNVLQINLAILK